MRAIKTIVIQNPRVVAVVKAQRDRGVGRSATEAAENLILEAVDRRRDMDHADRLALAGDGSAAATNQKPAATPSPQ